MADPRTDALVARINADPIWRERLAAAASEEELVATAVAAAEAHGEPRTAEEVRAYIAERLADGDRELSDTELEGVAGGSFIPDPMPT